MKKIVIVMISCIFMFGSMVLPVISGNNAGSNEYATINIIQNDGTLSGYVTDLYMDPLEDVRVRVTFHETYEEDYTDDTGYFHVVNIPICYCYKNASASKEGYQSEWVLLAIQENTVYDFILEEDKDIVCGNIDGSSDGSINIIDLVYLINYMFDGGEEPVPMLCVADVNADGNVNIVDLVYLVAFMFGDGFLPSENCCG